MRNLVMIGLVGVLAGMAWGATYTPSLAEIDSMYEVTTGTLNFGPDALGNWAVTISDEAQSLGLQMVQELGIHSHRAEFTMFEAARAYAASDSREEATTEDLRAVAPMALRMRRSEFMTQFFETQSAEDQQIIETFEKLEAK